MPRLVTKVPSYCHHSATGRAYVHLDGKNVYLLGSYGSEAAIKSMSALSVSGA